MIGEAFDGSNAGYAHGAYLTGVNSAENILKLFWFSIEISSNKVY